jgi:putative SOS response-associated peptidase YedK
VPDFGESFNVAPQTFQPVIRLNRDSGEREIVLMRWGLIPYWILLANSGGAAEVSENPGGLNLSMQHHLM